MLIELLLADKAAVNERIKHTKNAFEVCNIYFQDYADHPEGVMKLVNVMKEAQQSLLETEEVLAAKHQFTPLPWKLQPLK